MKTSTSSTMVAGATDKLPPSLVGAHYGNQHSNATSNPEAVAS